MFFIIYTPLFVLLQSHRRNLQELSIDYGKGRRDTQSYKIQIRSIHKDTQNIF